MAKNPAHLDSDIGVVMDVNGDDLDIDLGVVMDGNDDDLDIDLCVALDDNNDALDIDLGVVIDDNDDDLYVMDDNDDATQFDVCLGAESPLSANLTKLPNLSLPQLQSVNLARFDLNIRCARRPPLHKFHHKCKFGLYLM